MSWKRVCSAGEIAENSLKQFDLDGVTIVVANLGDEFRAYPPMCPHMEEPLAESGICNGGVLTCTKHLWQWDMLTGSEQGMAEKPLILYEVRRDGDEVSVFIEKELNYDYDE
jgi:toluene monooxygenase system ferredoxin subunit